MTIATPACHASLAIKCRRTSGRERLCSYKSNLPDSNVAREIASFDSRQRFLALADKLRSIQLVMRSAICLLFLSSIIM
jgi:hypothetical protein